MSHLSLPSVLTLQLSRGRLAALAAAAALTWGGCAKPARGKPTWPAGSPQAAAAGKPITAADIKKVRSFEGIDEYELPNGLKVLLFPDEGVENITVNITYFVGSRHEGYGETGMAHLLEHMLFKGTKDNREILTLVEQRGGWLNGSTWNDRTNYYETLPAKGDNLEWALAMEADRMRNATILQSDLDTEFSVVRSEFEIGENDPEAILSERMTSTAYLWHNYGKSTIGSKSDIEKVKAPRLRAFYDIYYQPDNAMLVVSGKFDAAKTLELVAAKFGGIPRPTRTIPETYTVEPVQDGDRHVVLRRAGDIAIAGLQYHVVAGAHPDFAAFDALASVLTREPTGRLYKALVPTKLASSVSPSLWAFRDPSQFGVFAEARVAAEAPKVLAKMIEVVETVTKHPITDEEVERWRAAEQKSLELALSDSEQIAISLSEWAARGDWRLLYAWREQIGRVTAADVNRVAKTYFVEDNRTSGLFVPTKAPKRAPAAEDLDIAKIVDAVKDTGGVSKGEEFVATFDSLQGRITTADIGGVKVQFLPKKTRGNKAVFRLSIHFGNEKDLQGRQMAAALLGDMLTRGTTSKSYAQVRDAEDKLRSDISVSASYDTLTIEVESNSTNLVEAVALALEMVRKPAFAASEFEIVRTEAITKAEGERSEPMSLSFVEISRMLAPRAPQEPQYTMTADEKIAALKKLTVADVRAFYNDFVGVGTANAAVIGAFDGDALTAALKKDLAGFAPKKRYERVVDKTFGVAPGQKTVKTPDKANAIFIFARELAMKDDHADAPALQVASYLLGGGTSSRLWKRIREKEGLSYGVGCGLQLGALDPASTMFCYGMVAPKNMKAADASVRAEMAAMAKGDITQAELDDTVKSLLGADDLALRDDDALLSRLTTLAFYGRTLAWDKEQQAKIRAVTLDDLKRVAAKYLADEGFSAVQAGDL